VGSLVAAWLIVRLVEGALPIIGVSFGPADPGTTTGGSVLGGLATVVLGGLIFQDIIRRERRSRRPPAPGGALSEDGRSDARPIADLQTSTSQKP
jgi:hypothetical protein